METSIPSVRSVLRVMGVVVALVALYFAVRGYRATARMEHDFPTYYLSSLDARTGENPYRDRVKQSPFIYPPLLLWLMTPLTFGGPQPMAIIWVGITLLAWGATVLLMYDACRALAPPKAGEDRTYLLWLPTLLAFRPLWRELGIGNVNMVVVACVTFGFWALVKRRDALAGAAIAFAAVLKILPLSFFVPLFAWRRWRALAVAIAMIPVWLVIPVVTYGPARQAQILDQFVHGRLFNHATDLSMDNHLGNQSLGATLNRWLSSAQPFHPVHHFHGSRINVARLPLPRVAAATGLIGLALGLFTLWVLWRSAHRPEMMGLGFAMVFCFTHLMSKKTWEEHLVSLLFVFTALLAGPRPWRRAGEVAVLLAAALNWLYTPLVWGRDGADALQVLGPSTMALLVLWVHLYRRLSEVAPQPEPVEGVEPSGVEMEPALA